MLEDQFSHSVTGLSHTTDRYKEIDGWEEGFNNSQTAKTDNHSLLTEAVAHVAMLWIAKFPFGDFSLNQGTPRIGMICTNLYKRKTERQMSEGMRNASEQ